MEKIVLKSKCYCGGTLVYTLFGWECTDCFNTVLENDNDIENIEIINIETDSKSKKCDCEKHKFIVL